MPDCELLNKAAGGRAVSTEAGVKSFRLDDVDLVMIWTERLRCAAFSKSPFAMLSAALWRSLFCERRVPAAWGPSGRSSRSSADAHHEVSSGANGISRK